MEVRGKEGGVVGEMVGEEMGVGGMILGGGGGRKEEDMEV